MRNRIKQTSVLRYYISSISFSVMATLIIGYIVEKIGGNIDNENPVDNFPLPLLLFVSVFLAPILETFLYQYLPYKLFKYLGINMDKKIGVISLISISSSLFGLSHPFSILYVVYTFIIGIVLMCVFYISYHYRSNRDNAFVLVVLIHSIINLLAFLGV